MKQIFVSINGEEVHVLQVFENGIGSVEGVFENYYDAKEAQQELIEKGYKTLLETWTIK